MIKGWAMRHLVVVGAPLLVAHFLTAQESKSLPVPSTPGKAIRDATEAAVRDRANTEPAEILSDTQGVDFGPYIQRVQSDVQANWYARIPDSAKTKKGSLTIEFSIQGDGHVLGTKMVASSGDLELDRAAWGGILGSTHLPPLPKEFKGDNLRLRFRFYYNPNGPDYTFTHALPIQAVANAHTPKYPKKAHNAGLGGIVRLEAAVGDDGKVKGFRVLEGSATFVDASVSAISKWKFEVAKRDGIPVADEVPIKIVFRLDPEQVRAQVVWPDSAAAASPPGPR